MSRPRKDPAEVKDKVYLRLPRYLIEKLEQLGKPQEVIEKILKEYFKLK